MRFIVDAEKKNKNQRSRFQITLTSTHQTYLLKSFLCN